jgi:hypothetical protein
VTGRCRRCWSHAKAKTQSQDKMFTFPAFHLGALALREVNSSNRQTLESGQSGMLSDCLPVSLTPFRHPRAKLGWRNGVKNTGSRLSNWTPRDKASGDVNPSVTARCSRGQNRIRNSPERYRPIDIDRSPWTFFVIRSGWGLTIAGGSKRPKLPVLAPFHHPGAKLG